MNEEWKDIIGYEGLYQISSLGRVKRIFVNNKTRNQYSYNKEEIILKPQQNGNGYLWVRLYKNKKPKKYYIHHLIGNMFLTKQKNETEINHKDKNKQNNAVSNLEWCTHKHNMEHGKGTFIIYVSKSTELIIFKSINDCAKYLNINTRHIRKHRKGHLLFEEDLI